MKALDVSVVIAARNAADTLPQALVSALAQTLTPREVLVVDDGSLDDTAATAAGFGGVRLLRQPHLGVSAARNRGIAAARGDWIAVLDADDAWLPCRLECVSEVINAVGLCLVGPNAWVWRPPETTAEARLRDERVFAAPRGYRSPAAELAWLFARTPVLHPILPRAVVLRARYDEDLTLGEDTELLWRLATGGLPVRLVDEPLGFYRCHRDPERYGDVHTAMLRRERMLVRALERCGHHALAAPRIRRDLRHVRRLLAYLAWTRALRQRDMAAACVGFAPWMLVHALRSRLAGRTR